MAYALTSTSHTFTHGYANTCVPTRRHICSVECACASVLPPNKAGCLLLAGFGGRFASMPSLSPEKGGMQRGRWSAERRGDVAFRGGPAQAQKWQLVLLHLLWACCACAEEDRCSNQLIQDSTNLCQGGEAPAPGQWQEENMEPLPAICEAVQQFCCLNCNCNPWRSSGLG